MAPNSGAKVHTRPARVQVQCTWAARSDARDTPVPLTCVLGKQRDVAFVSGVEEDRPPRLPVLLGDQVPLLKRRCVREVEVVQLLCEPLRLVLRRSGDRRQSQSRNEHSAQRPHGASNEQARLASGRQTVQGRLRFHWQALRKQMVLEQTSRLLKLADKRDFAVGCAGL